MIQVLEISFSRNMKSSVAKLLMERGLNMTIKLFFNVKNQDSCWWTHCLLHII